MWAILLTGERGRTYRVFSLVQKHSYHSGSHGNLFACDHEYILSVVSLGFIWVRMFQNVTWGFSHWGRTDFIKDMSKRRDDRGRRKEMVPLEVEGP
jgi:hypothetical protein